VKRTVQFDGDDGAFMLVDVVDAQAHVAIEDGASLDVELVSDDTGVRRAAGKLEDSLESVRGAAVALMSTASQIPEGRGGLALDEISLEVGVRLGVEGGVLVAKGSAEAAVLVTLTWRRSTNA
jgi:hypothetical protein